MLSIGETVLIPSAFPRAAEILERSGFRVQPVDVSELQKAEAGVTCMSLVFEAQQPVAVVGPGKKPGPVTIFRSR